MDRPVTLVGPLNLIVEIPHTGITIWSAIVDELQKWGLKDKIFVITFDNASNNDVAEEYLKHCLNLPLSEKLF